MNELKSTNHPISPRRYTLAEIDMMREFTSRLMRFSQGDRLYDPSDKIEVEMRLRTYLLAEIDPKELADELQKQIAAWKSINNEFLQSLLKKES